MILTNRLNFFDKLGNEINMMPDPSVTATVMNASGGGGAEFNIYTNRDGNIELVEIVNGGSNYVAGTTFIKFKNELSDYFFETTPADLTFTPGGTITSIGGLSTSPGIFTPANKGFVYPSVVWKGEMYFDRVSVGLIENQEIFVLEKVVKSPIDISTLGYSFPRADEGPLHLLGSYRNQIPKQSVNGNYSNGIGSVSVAVYTQTGNISVGRYEVFSIVNTTNLQVGMVAEGLGIPPNTTITSIVSLNTIMLSAKCTSTILSASIDFYMPHNFVAGMKIRVGDTASTLQFSGSYDVYQVTSREIFFKTPNSVPIFPITVAASTSYFRACPIWRGRVLGSEEEIFLFTIEYKDSFPEITKTTAVTHDPIDGENLAFPDSYFSGGISIDNNTNYQYRVVSENWVESLMQFHLGFTAGTEGNYVKYFVLEDITFPYAPTLISQISLRGEAVGEDERLEKLLENFGRDITENQELILRDSDVNEDLPDYLLLNKKRKEMLLQGDEIWPYLGSYKGLVNIINWFGYYDMRIKEYWLNVNKNDVYYRKFKQIQIPFQLEKRGNVSSSISMLPSKVYSKTNKFGLFYDLNKESGVFDEFGIPVTVDAFQFSNQEILIKLFALKQYLLNSFLPLTAKIVDIVGEGVYYERYAANTWNDRLESLNVELTRNINFEAVNSRIPIQDARRFNSAEKAFSYAPGTDKLENYYNTYTVTGVNITTPLVTVYPIPTMVLTTASGLASPKQQWGGEAYVKALPGVYTPSSLSYVGGFGYQSGDIITLNGGTFSNPIRVKVITVLPNGYVTTIQVLSGLDQGSRYMALPTGGFSQISVMSEDLVNNLYYGGQGQGFKLGVTDIQYVLEGVVTTTIGIGYSCTDPLVLNAFDPVTGLTIVISHTLNLKTVPGPYVGYFNNGKKMLGLTNEPNVPVSAFLDLKALGLDAYWDQMLFSWETLWGAEDATLKAYIDPLPAGTGAVVAIEIIDPGTGYNRTPTLDFLGGQGANATAVTKTLNGKLAIYNFAAASSVPLSASTSRITFTTPFSILPIPFSVGAMVTGVDLLENQIPKPATIINIDPAGFYIDISKNYTAAVLNIKIHEGALLTASGNGYVTPPDVSTTGGHTEFLYTWSEIGRGNFYEMEWRIDSETGTSPFAYTSGRGSIDKLVNHSVQLPFKGLYKVEVIMHDTENNWVNEIKRDYVDVYMPEASTTMATRFLGPSTTPGASDGTETSSMKTQLTQNCVDTWEEGFFKWDEYWGRWINPFKTWTTWKDCDIEWATLDVTALGPENNWSYPVVPSYGVYRVSAYDNFIGDVFSFNATTGVVVINYPMLDEQRRPLVQVGEFVYFGRDDLTFQAGVTVGAIATPTTYTFTISPATVWPDNFEANFAAWGVFRELANTVVIEDDLFTPDNGKTVVPGQFITLTGTSDTKLNDTRFNLLQPPYTWGIPINSKLTIGGFTAGMTIASAFGTPGLTTADRWVNGQIYRYRNDKVGNGKLKMFSSTTIATAVTAGVFIERLDSPTEYNWGNRGMIYINNTAGSAVKTDAFPLQEITPGFTYINLIVSDLNAAQPQTLYQQHFRTINMYEDTSNQGHPWNIWSEPTQSKIICIEVEAIDGKKFDEILSKLASLNIDNNLGNYGWFEYKYDVFPTRSYSAGPVGLNWGIVMDFNTRPVLGSFETSTAFPATPATGLGWYYDSAISTGDFSLEVTNVGKFLENPLWTIMTVKDPNTELYRCDSTFVETARDFDEDYAETHLGVKLAWAELYELNWFAACSQTWSSTDWPYTLFPNWRFDINSTVAGRFYVGLNEITPHVINIAGNTKEQSAALIVDLLNNNFMKFAPIGGSAAYPYNDNPGASKFYYELLTTDKTLDIVTKLVCSYGDPSSTSLTVLGGAGSLLPIGRVIHGENIFPGWMTTSTGPTLITTAQDGPLFPTFASPANIPWVPSCIIHANVNQRNVSNITGFMSSLPQEGWVYDMTLGAVIGNFGRGVGKVTEENGFVSFFELNAPPVPPTPGLRQLAIYPKRTSLVSFIAKGALDFLYIAANSKSPGSDSLGYLKMFTGPATPIFPQEYLEDDVALSIPMPTITANTSFPVGSYYNWVSNLNIFYGAGLEDSVLQYSQPYRNIQTYIYEGSELQANSADNGGWYPSATWGSYNYINGLNTFLPVFPSWPNMPYPWNVAISTFNMLQYKPIAEVDIFNGITGAQIIATSANKLFTLVLNTLFDGHAMIIDNNNQCCDFTLPIYGLGAANAYGYPIVIKVRDISGVGYSEIFSCLIAEARNGILCKSVTYFDTFATTDTTLIYDWNAYIFNDIVATTNATFQTGAEPVIYPGMKVGYITGTTPINFTGIAPEVVEYDNDNKQMKVDIPHTLVPSATVPRSMFAYSPLNLRLKLQPTNEKVWSQTKQSDSMKLLYEQSFNGAFTWEDSTISVSEKRIPAGASVVFSSDASDIAGKTKFLWSLYHEGTKLVSVTDANFLWTFLEPGDYDVSLEITDTNGNKQSKYSKTFIDVYLAEQHKLQVEHD